MNHSTNSTDMSSSSSEDESEDDSENNRRQRKMLLLCYWSTRQQRKEPYCGYFRSQLNAEGRKRRNRHLPRCSLPAPQLSAWETVFNSGNDGALITVTGMDHAAFKELLKIYQPFFKSYTPWTGNQDGRNFIRLPVKKKGRTRLISPTASLGLVLA
jgi:hypothetical protein